MASSLKAPEPFSFSASDLATQWAVWRRQFQWFLIATRKEEDDEEVLVGVLLTLLGIEGLKVYDTFTFATEGDSKKIEPVLNKFDGYFEPRRSEVFERFKFLRRHQQQGESFDTWLVDLRALIKNCNYGDASSAILRDQIVLGVADGKVREKLLFEKDLTLEKATEITRACESSKSQLSQIEAQSTEAEKTHSLDHRKARRQENRSGTGGQKDENKKAQCPNCGRQHGHNNCRAVNVTCFQCGSVGHYASCCSSNRRPPNRDRRESAHPRPSRYPPRDGRVHTVDDEYDYLPQRFETGFNFDEDYVVQALETNGSDKEWFENISVDGVMVKFKLDSGASCDLLPYELFKCVPRSLRRLQPGPKVRSYGAKGGYLSVVGVYCTEICHKNKVNKVSFVVVDEPGQPAILGLRTCERLNLIHRVHVIKPLPVDKCPTIVFEFSDVFSNQLGRLPVAHDIKLITGEGRIQPTVSAASRLPFKLEKTVFNKLDEMVKNHIITPVTEPTEWVSRMVVVGKPNGDVRVCLDPSALNKAIQRQHFTVPTAEQLFAKIGNAKYFCSLDAASGFYQIPLTEEASYLCTMATPRGRYRFLRMPFGIKSAPEVYIETMASLFGDLKGALIYFDDFLVVGETLQEVEVNLRQVLVRCRKHNLKLQLSKCRFFEKELPWLGHVITEGALKVDPEKVKAIVNMPEPEDKKGLVRLLGMVTYLDKFCQNLASLTRPLRDLLKDDTAWTWEEPQKAVMKKIKTAVTTLPVLRLFDPSKPVVVSADASSIGIGAVLLQDGQPVAYASTSLTPTQKRYFQIEKELLAVQFGLMRFRQYVFGQPVVVETDHNPLIGLLEKPIAASSPRIQRMRLQLQRFDFSLRYKPGKELFVADALSRAPVPNQYQDDVTQLCEEQVFFVLHQIAPAADTRARYAEATAEDPTLQLVKKLTLKGWPDHKSQCPVPAKPYWTVKHDIAEVDGLLLYKERLIVPTSLRQEVLKGIHSGHFGETKCVLRARSAIYWPGCEDQVKNVVASCNICQSNRTRNPSQPLYPVELPVYPFQFVSADIFKFQGRSYLLTVDAYSKWPCAAQVKDLSAAATVMELDRIFADFGSPEVIKTDNGTHFANAEMRAFCARHNCRLVTSSPEYPRSNGLPERHIQTVKRTLLKMLQEERTLSEALAAIRSTPLSESLPSPAVLLQSRNLRGALPFLRPKLQPAAVPATRVVQQLQKKQAEASFFHRYVPDIRCSSLRVGQYVRVLVSGIWLRGVVTEVCPEPNSYLVKTSDGRSFRRNRSAINVDKLPPVVRRIADRPGQQVSSPWRDLLDVPKRRVLTPQGPAGRVVAEEPRQREPKLANQVTPTVTQQQQRSTGRRTSWSAAEAGTVSNSVGKSIF
ncbi:uncharacterized protein K02A2.6-like [Daphnia carinata]|uniref:uncharacterized protein K02A2.6-like n=1 Tax=Daphnia carinata TaxID=120202 RepID=UPI00257C2BE2|nr:uncharacterized protein K02A2.6-like [Daphnia carinata]